jgi:hypothetical protein
VTKHTVQYRFTEGQQVHLDEIYAIQGLGDDVDGVDSWWEPNNEAGETVTITRNIKITVTFKSF